MIMTREELLDELEYYGDIERPKICPITNDSCCRDKCEGCPEDEEYRRWLEENEGENCNG